MVKLIIHNESAKPRMNKVIKAIEGAEKIPKAPRGCSSLKDSPESWLFTYAGNTVTCWVEDMTKAEIRFVLKMVRQCGYTPKW